VRKAGQRMAKRKPPLSIKSSIGGVGEKNPRKPPGQEEGNGGLETQKKG